MDNKLTQKYLVEGGYRDTPSMAIVYGVVSPQNFNVKKQDNIVGYVFMLRVPLNYSGLFDKFDDAVKHFKKLAAEYRKRLRDEGDELGDRVRKIEVLQKSVKNSRLTDGI